MEQIKLEHPLFKEYPNKIEYLLNNQDEFSTNLDNYFKFLSKIKENKDKGDYFEIFIEYFIKSLENSSTLGILNYKPNKNKDKGIDGSGEFKGKITYIQCKFSSKRNNKDNNKYKNIGNFFISIGKCIKDTHFLFSLDENINIKANTHNREDSYNVQIWNKERIINSIASPNFMSNFIKSLNYTYNNQPKYEPKELYPHQKEALDECMQKTKGIILLPTGSGKSIIEINLIKNELKDKNKFLGIFFTPKILLNKQILEECIKELKISYEDLHYMQYDSSQNNSRLHNFEYGKDLNKLKDKHLIICTYKSGSKLFKNLKKLNLIPNIIIYDEAHYLICNEWNKLIQNENKIIKENKIINEDNYEDNYEYNYEDENELNLILTNNNNKTKQFFFTATKKDKELSNSTGMNNTDKYGEIIFERNIAQMISEKRISPIDMIDLFKESNSLNLEEKETNGNKNFFNKELICKSIEKFKKYSKKESFKLLSIIPYKENFQYIINNFNTIKKEWEDAHIFLFHSNENIGYRHNNEKMSKEDCMDNLKELSKDKNEKILIFHFNILTEGIDIPFIDGIIPFMRLSKTRFLQNLGRATRYQEGKTSYVIIPDLTEEDKTLYTTYYSFFNDIGYDMTEIIQELEIDGSKDEDLKNLYKEIKESKNKNTKEYEAFHIAYKSNINEYIKKYINDDLDLKNKTKYYNYITNILYINCDNNEYKGLNNKGGELKQRIPNILLSNLITPNIKSSNLDFKNKTYLVLYNIEICLELIKNGINKNNIYLFSSNKVWNIYTNYLFKEIYIEDNFDKLDILSILKINNMKFDFILSNPPYNCEGLKAKQNMVFYKSFLEQGRKLANECYFVGPYSYLSSYKNLGITEIHKLGKETFDIAIQTAWVKIDSNQTENTFIDENILYSPIPKLKIKEKEVDMSLAGIFINHNGNQKGKENFYKEKQNEDDIKIYSTSNTFYSLKYIMKN